MRKPAIILLVLILFISGCSVSNVEEDQNTSKSETSKEEETEVFIPNKTVSEETHAVEGETNEDEKRVEITLFYQDGEGVLIPVTRKAVIQEGIARAAINCLTDSPLIREGLEYYGLYPTLPEGTRVIGLTIREGTAVIDFSKEILDYSSQSWEVNIFSSIVYTLTEFKTIDNVIIWINGYEYDRLKYGSHISGKLNRKNICVNEGKLNAEEGIANDWIFLLKKSELGLPFLIPVSFRETGEDGERMLTDKITMLQNPGSLFGLYTEIPPGTNLNSGIVSEDTMIIDLSSEILNYEGNESEEAIIKQLIYSMASDEKILKKLVIKIDGKDMQLKSGASVYKGIDFKKAINEFVDKY